MMHVYVGQQEVTIANAPVGLLRLKSDGTMICKTEYRRESGICECYIVESGEAYHGEGDDALCYPIVIQ